MFRELQAIVFDGKLCYIIAVYFIYTAQRCEIMQKIKDFFIRLYNAETESRRWSRFVICTALGIVLGAALLVVVVDPHYRYHEPWFYDKVYYEVYATAPHILQHENYDLLVLGTSMTRNFFLEDINSTFECNAVKLAASGGTSQDLCKFFQVAKDAKGDKLKRVIISLDTYSLNKTEAHWKEFEYMYREDHLEDYRYLFSRQSFSSMIYLIKRKTSPKKQRPHQSDRNRMFATEYKGKPYGYEEVIADALHNENIRHSPTPYNPEAHRKNFAKLLEIFDRNPDMEFIVYLPPYHIYTFCLSSKLGEAEGLLKQRTMVMKELLKRRNVKVYDFQGDRKYVCDFANFSDVQHFCNPMAKEVLADLKNGRRQVTSAAQVDALEAELRALIAEKMPEYERDLNKYREKH